MASRRKTTSMRGKLLLDGGKLQGSWFHRSVVLICQHDAEGAFGLVLNRPSEARVGEALAGDVPPGLAEAIVRVGGPVQPAAMSYLHCDLDHAAGSVMPGIELGHSAEKLFELGAAAAPGRHLLVFAGYAGWSPGQLDDELSKDAWLIQPATFDLILDADPATLWRRVVSGMGGLYRLLADSPDDLAAN